MQRLPSFPAKTPPAHAILSSAEQTLARTSDLAARIARVPDRTEADLDPSRNPA